MNFDLLNDIVIDPKLKASINYAKARASIETLAKNRKEKRDAKQIVVSHLNGVHITGKTLYSGERLPSSVKFPDNSIARF